MGPGTVVINGAGKSAGAIGAEVVRQIRINLPTIAGEVNKLIGRKTTDKVRTR